MCAFWRPSLAALRRQRANQRVMELLDMGFARAPARATIRQPELPVYGPDSQGGTQGRVIRMSGAVSRSIRPVPRPGRELEPALVAAIESSVEAALAVAQATPEIPQAPEFTQMPAAQDPEGETPLAEAVEVAMREAEPAATPLQPGPDGVVLLSGEAVSSTRPRPRPIDIDRMLARAEPIEPEIVIRSSSSGNRLYGVAIGRYTTQNAAERALLTTALAELGTFDEALRNVANRGSYFEAQFAGMTEAEADRACIRLIARNLDCIPFGPG